MSHNVCVFPINKTRLFLHRASTKTPMLLATLVTDTTIITKLYVRHKKVVLDVQRKIYNTVTAYFSSDFQFIHTHHPFFAAPT